MSREGSPLYIVTGEYTERFTVSKPLPRDPCGLWIYDQKTKRGHKTSFCFLYFRIKNDLFLNS